MSYIFFSSDYHLGHANICRYCKRPWLRDGDIDSDGKWISSSVAHERASEMTEAIIRNHNSRIAFGDTMVHVGDFCCRGKERGDPGMRTHAEQYASRLSGTVVFVRGNHDDNNGLKHAFDTLTFKAGGFNFFVRHKPVHMIGEVPYDCTVMLCGHVHEKWKSMVLEDEERRVLMINVGIDVWNFHPIRLDEVIGFACKRFREIDIERA